MPWLRGDGICLRMMSVVSVESSSMEPALPANIPETIVLSVRETLSIA